MQKFKLVLLIILVLAVASCSQEQSESIEVQNDYSQLYYKLINNGGQKNGIDFDNFNNQEKLGVWEFKFDLYLSDYNLSNSQKDAILLTKKAIRDYYETGDSADLDLAEATLRNNFNGDQIGFMMYTLHNYEQNSIQKNTLSEEGCFWCDEVISYGECCAYTDPSDGSIVDFRRPTLYRVRRFFIGIETIEGWSSCSVSDFNADGGFSCQLQ